MGWKDPVHRLQVWLSRIWRDRDERARGTLLLKQELDSLWNGVLEGGGTPAHRLLLGLGVRMGKIVMEGRKDRVNHLPEYLLGRVTGGGVTGWKVFVGIVGWHKGMDLIEEMCWRVHREGETWIHYKVQQSLWRMEVGWEGGAVAGLATWLQFLFLFALLSHFHWLLDHAAESISDCLEISPEKKINPMLFKFSLVRFLGQWHILTIFFDKISQEWFIVQWVILKPVALAFYIPHCSQQHHLPCS